MSNKFKTFWTGEYNSHWDDIYTERFELTKGGKAFEGSENVVVKRLDEDELIEKLKGVEIFIDGYDKVTEKVLANCPDLKLILSIRDGPEESVDIDACNKYGVPVLFPGGRCLHSVAELTAALILMCAKPIITQVNYVRENGLTKEGKADINSLYGEYFEVYGKTLGLIGFGRNTKELSKFMKAMGMKVIAYDPYCTDKVAEEYGINLCSLEDTLRNSDYVVLGARVTPETTRMIGKEQFSMMKKTACFINTARSQLVDNDALVEALRNNVIYKAAVDVFEKDPQTKQDLPLTKDHPYFSIDPNRLILTPHMAGFSQERTYNAYALLEPSYQNFLKGSKELVIKNPEVFDSPEFENRGKKMFGIE